MLRYLLAAVLLIGIVGGGAYGVTRLLNDDDDAPKSSQVASVPEATVTPASPPAQDSVAEQPAPTVTTAPPPTETAAPAPTEPPAASGGERTGTSEDAAQTPETETISSNNTQAFLPPASALDGEWAITDDGERTKAQVADAIGANGDELLTSWRWRDNFYRDLTRIDPASFPNETTYINVSVHRFANADGAAEALTALSDIVVEIQGLQEVETPVMGELARGLSGPGDGVNLYVLYVQDGKYLIRIGGSSATGDPAATVNGLAQTILADQQSTA